MPAGSKPTIALHPRELAERPPVRECFQWFTREKQWINERHLQLCRIPAPTFLEQERAEWMADQLHAAGWNAEIDRAGNVVARLGNADGPLVALTAHLDTVLAPRNKDEITVEPDGTLRGPGVSDNGAGLAGLLAIARAVRLASPFGDAGERLLLAANVGEEGEGNLSGMRYLARQSPVAPRIKSYIVLDGPALDHITSQALASRRFELVFTGPGGHSWSDYGTANPIHALSHAIASFTDRCAASPRRVSYNFGILEGGVSVNSIPALARAKVDLRSEDSQALDEVAETLSEAVEHGLEVENRRASGAKLAAKIREIGSRPGGRLAENSPILACVRAVDAFLGIRSRLDVASTDANIPLSLGIPAVSIGAGGRGGGAHTPAEWYHPEGRDLGLKRILLVLAMLLGDETPITP
ncbi:MAG TPA: M20/M25/M40 family metallo-hydrolase [Bryobacteraceae bacterium]|nr:M20/M25/M40 family metallo-hydrolase [Bryobacteraceae bacterium]HOQ47121.1 M20/M25/M40 family metallo-hydrolase [Bryobacteraceae bacterium]HPU72488.1 M20/M25/M40 family metallo-hydrolase [Bryobacteraceae bacterium]